MKKGFLLLALSLLISMSACTAGDAVKETPTALTPAPAGKDLSVETLPSPPEGADYPAVDLLTIAEADYPRIDGSTATIPLGEATAAVLMGKPREECAEYAAFTGTANAYRQLSLQETDLLIVYEAAESTITELSNGGKLEDIFNIAPIGSDGLVFLVNAENPVDSLTVEQLRKIYAGEITNWSEVGGEDAPIAAFQRNRTAGSQALIEKLVMDGTPMAEPREDYIAESMGGLLTAVSDFNTGRYALGYNVYYYVTEMKKDSNVKILAVDDVIPEKETIQQETYPLVHDFYVVTRKDEAPDSPTSQVAEWLQGEEGQMLIVLEGYVAK